MNKHKNDAALAASRPNHFADNPTVCQEDAHQAAALVVLRDAVINMNPTDEQTAYLQMAMVFGATNDADHSTFAPVLPGVDSLCLSPPQTAALAAGRSQADFPVDRCTDHAGGFPIQVGNSWSIPHWWVVGGLYHHTCSTTHPGTTLALPYR